MVEPVVPISLQIKPGGQGLQSLIVKRPVPLEKVPTGHLVPLEDPARQYWEIGQGAPRSAARTMGALVFDPAKQ